MPFQHSGLKHPRREIRLCEFVREGLRTQSHAIELEIAHYTLDNVVDYDYLDDDGILFANFESDQVASISDDHGQRQSVKYTAVSYCWGDPTIPYTIGLNGQDFEVSGNLYHLLGVLRDTQDGQRLLWIDQLCINQLNTSERNNQVSLMSFIYSSAEAVYVWLGNSTPGTVLGFRMIRSLEGAGTWPEQTREQNILVRSGDVATNHEATALLAARDLLTREYWTRLWIVQEVVYARRLLFLCGTYNYEFGTGKEKPAMSSWNDRLSSALKQNTTPTGTLETTAASDPLAFNASYILPKTLSLLQDFFFMQEIRQGRRGGAGYILSFDAVTAHGWRRCRDPRDKIFGLQSLVSPGYRVEINYEKSTKEILEEWVAETTSGHGGRSHKGAEDRMTLKSLHSDLGLGAMSEEYLDELLEGRSHRRQVEQRSGRSKSRLSRMAWWPGCNKLLISIAVVICGFWLYSECQRGAAAFLP